MPVVLTRATQQAAGYRPVGGIERCASCRFYGSANNCGRILGPVSPAGWCRFFSRMVWLRMDGGDDYFGTAGPPGATLNLSFLDGTLPTGVTFTRASTARYSDSTGTMRTAATNVPRFDYSPSTRTLNGLLIEESRTNLNPWSVDFTQAPWAKLNSSLGAATVAPDGTVTGTRIVENTTAGVHGVSQSISKAASALPFTYSVYCKANQRTQLNLLIEGAASGYVQCTFDLSAGTQLGAFTSGTWTNAAATIVNAGNGWYRCILSATSNTDAGVYIDAYLTNGSTTNYTGDGVSSAYVWGAQLEQAAFPTSYIATSGASATRAADVATIASIPGRNAAAESFAAEFLLITTQHAGFAIVGDNASTKQMVGGSSALQGASWDTVAALLTGNTFALGTVAKVAVTWASPNAGKACLNAGAVASATTQTAGYASVATFKLMDDSTGAPDAANGYIRRVRYWPRVLTNTEMQQATT